MVYNFFSFHKEEYGHMLLLGILDSVDDTKIVGKAVLGELLEQPEELFTNKYGVRLLKYLFGGRDTKYVMPDAINILKKVPSNFFETTTPQHLNYVHSLLCCSVNTICTIFIIDFFQS